MLSQVVLGCVEVAAPAQGTLTWARSLARAGSALRALLSCRIKAAKAWLDGEKQLLEQPEPFSLKPR